MFYLIQVLIVAALIGSLIDSRRHRKAGPQILAIVSAAFIIYGINAGLDVYYIYPGVLGFLGVSIWNSQLSKRDEAADD